MGIQITTNPIDLQIQNNNTSVNAFNNEQEIVIFEEQSIDNADALELNNVSSRNQALGTEGDIQSEKIKALNAKLKNISKDEILSETINEQPYNKEGKDGYGLTNEDYILLCSINPNLNEEIIKQFGARAAYFTDRSLNDLPAEMKANNFKKHGSQAEAEMLEKNPYTNNGMDKFGKTEQDYYKMLEQYGISKEIIDATKLGARRAYFAHIQNLANSGVKVQELEEVNK